MKRKCSRRWPKEMATFSVKEEAKSRLLATSMTMKLVSVGLVEEAQCLHREEAPCPHKDGVPCLHREEARYQLKEWDHH